MEDELRLKSNEDLHKLWFVELLRRRYVFKYYSALRYVLLKERNMIMTMEAEYKRTANLMPAPERLEKVISQMREDVFF